MDGLFNIKRKNSVIYSLKPAWLWWWQLLQYLSHIFFRFFVVCFPLWFWLALPGGQPSHKLCSFFFPKKHCCWQFSEAFQVLCWGNASQEHPLFVLSCSFPLGSLYTWIGILLIVLEYQNSNRCLLVTAAFSFLFSWVFGHSPGKRPLNGTSHSSQDLLDHSWFQLAVTLGFHHLIIKNPLHYLLLALPLMTILALIHLLPLHLNPHWPFSFFFPPLLFFAFLCPEISWFFSFFGQTLPTSGSFPPPILRLLLVSWLLSPFDHTQTFHHEAILTYFHSWPSPHLLVLFVYDTRIYNWLSLVRYKSSPFHVYRKTPQSFFYALLILSRRRFYEATSISLILSFCYLNRELQLFDHIFFLSFEIMAWDFSTLLNFGQFSAFFPLPGPGWISSFSSFDLSFVASFSPPIVPILLQFLPVFLTFHV